MTVPVALVPRLVVVALQLDCCFAGFRCVLPGLGLLAVGSPSPLDFPLSSSLVLSPLLVRTTRARIFPRGPLVSLTLISRDSLAIV